MNKRMCFLFLACALLFSTESFAAFDVAITVDDLPIHGDLPPNGDRSQIAETMIKAFEKHNVTGVYGFINAKQVADDPSTNTILKKWVASGQMLGNHTYSHADIVKISVAAYLEEIKKNNPILADVMGKLDFRYFRYPYLAEGDTKEKRDGVRNFLFQSNYKVAEVTMDFFDYEWANPYVRCLKKNDQKSITWLKQSFIEQALNGVDIAHSLSNLLYGRDIKFILLTHIGAFEAEMMDELIAALQSKGARFISLPDALSDEVYKTNPNVLRERTYTFLSQVRISRGLKNPPNVQRLYEALPEKQLEEICR